MTALSLPCPRCSGTREATYEDRHAGTRMDVCRTCEDTGTIPARTGETREASFNLATAVKPVRLRLSRRAGFDLQAHSLAVNGLPAVRVARPGKFGNPFTLEMAYEVEDCSREGARELCVGWFREWITQADDHHDQSDMGSYGWLREDRTKLLAALPSLRGKNLACFCGKGDFWNPIACHADVLLELANAPTSPEPAPARDGVGR